MRNRFHVLQQESQTLTIEGAVLWGIDERLVESGLDVIPEAQLALFIFGTRHIPRIAYPPFPDRPHSRPIDRALSLNGIGRVRRLPFTFGARFAGPLFLME